MRGYENVAITKHYVDGKKIRGKSKKYPTERI